MHDRPLLLLCRSFALVAAACLFPGTLAASQWQIPNLAGKNFKDVRQLAKDNKIPVIVHIYQAKELKVGDTTFDESKVIANSWESQPDEVLEYQQESNYSRLGVVIDTSSIPPGDIVVINTDDSDDEDKIPFDSFIFGLVLTGVVAAGVGFTIGYWACKSSR